MLETTELLENFFDSYMPSLSGNLRENRLERMTLLLERLGNPESSFSSIHVAGSKGKGTTSTFLSSLLGEKAKTGLYLSPHVYDIRERFTLSSHFFRDEEYIETLEELKKALEGFSLPHHLGPEKPTTFELYTAYAYLLFRNTGCAYAVIETGLGGRLDATNTLSPLATLFTPIEKEHTRILGDDISQIAREKAGIMRAGVPSFSMTQTSEVEKTLRSEAEAIGSSISFIDTDREELRKAISGDTISINGSRIKLGGRNDLTSMEDLAFAYGALLSLGLIDGSADHDVSATSSLPARFERVTLKSGIEMVFDGAHTPQSARELSSNLKECYGEKVKVLIFCTAEDKNYSEMASILIPNTKSIVITPVGSWKKSKPEEIYAFLKEEYPTISITLEMDGRRALEKAISESEGKLPIVVAGSFYLASTIKEAIKEGEL